MIKARPVSEETFSGMLSTSAFNYNRHWEWVHDGSEDMTVFIDRKIPELLYDMEKKRKFAWLLESRTIIPDTYSWVEEYAEVLGMYCSGVFTHDLRLVNQGSPFIYAPPNACPWVMQSRIYPKTNLVSMIASNKSWAEGHKHRLQYVDKFRGRVDFFGRGFNWIETKDEGLIPYMFSIAIENCKYDNYYTEKVTDCFATGTVPVFYGADSIGRDFAEEGIIRLTEDFDLDTLTPDLYNSMKDAIAYNFYQAINMETSEDYIWDWMQDGLGS